MQQEAVTKHSLQQKTSGDLPSGNSTGFNYYPIVPDFPC